MGEIKKIFYSMGEVSEMLDVNPSLLRFWEKKFDILRPKKNKKGNRMFTPEDVRNLKIIYHLVKENGMTLAGAQKRMKQSRADIERDMELSERLHAIKALLLEVKQHLDDSPAPGSEIIIDSSDAAPETDITPELNEPMPEMQPDTIEEEDAAAVTKAPCEGYDEDLEQEIETAFAAMNQADESGSEYDIFEDEQEPDYTDFDTYDEMDGDMDDAEEEPVEDMDDMTEEPEDVAEEEPDEEPQTETILEDGMLFAVQAIKPKPAAEETTAPAPQQTETPAKEPERPTIIEQTLF